MLGKTTSFDGSDLSANLDPASSQNPIDRLRKQARQRFIGALVLVVLALIGLPFLLDSQPRPLANSIQIEIPKTEGKPFAAPTDNEVIPAVPDVAVAPPAKPEPAASTFKAPLAFAPAKPEVHRAQALLDGSKDSKRPYVVQAGSFSDPEALQATTSKLTKAGIKFSKQAATSKDGSPRTRIRLKNTFATKDEADLAAAAVSKLGIPVFVFQLETP